MKMAIVPPWLIFRHTQRDTYTALGRLYYQFNELIAKMPILRYQNNKAGGLF